MDALLLKLQALLSFEVSAAVLSLVVVGVELALRLFKSEKPLSILYGVALGCHKVASLVDVVSKLIKKLADLLDQVLPQRTLPPQ